MADYYVILNANAGTAHALGVTGDAIKALFDKHGLNAIVDDDVERKLSARIKRALASDAGIIVAAGGDGTITAIANALVGTDKTMAILPLGTVNALAKDLRLPLNLEQAVLAIATGETQAIDVGEVNGHAFLHKVVVGLIPGVAAGREYIRGRTGLSVKLGFLRYFFRRIVRTRRMAVAIDTAEGRHSVERVQAFAVASNAYDEGIGQFFSRQRLDRGHLTLYVLKHFTRADFIRLTTGMVMGRWHADEALTIESVQGVTISSHRQTVKVMLDGEVRSLNMPLQFNIRPLALSVIVPQSSAAANAPATVQGAAA